MKNIYKNSPKNLSKAKRILKKNNVIAVPTETVYGLAGNSYSDSAVKKIYKLKKRPKKNPLIIHYYSIDRYHYKMGPTQAPGARAERPTLTNL